MNQQILGDKKKSNFDENLADKVNQIFDKMPETPKVKPVIGNVRLEKASDGFIFYNLPGVGSVKLLNEYLAGSPKSQDNWRIYCDNRSDGVVVPNSVILYQMARVLYKLRNVHDYQELVKECLVLFNKDWAEIYTHTGTKVSYGAGLDAVVASLQLDGSTKKISLKIPEFIKANDDWSYFVLAPEHAEKNLGTVNVIPDNARPVLQALLGEGYERAGEVFQYVSPRENDNLREIRLWTPTLTKRNSERVVVFGVDNIDDYDFGINASGSINDGRPSRGVVAVHENSEIQALNELAYQAQSGELTIPKTNDYGGK
ncbi:hypothetical protein HZA97_01155 [Candidatus Woesearchaeota archaeon]|nr:hypothetical protein [Candidatus Woesearchaeota archaeon]